MLKSCFKVSFKCPESYKSLFKNSSCCLTISVGQEQHEGEKLLSTIEAINQKFNSCHVVLGDTLQRHAFLILFDISIENAYDQSYKAGSDWLERNKSILNKLEIEHSISRWDDWIKNSKFNKYKNNIISHYKQDLIFQEAMKNTVDEVYNRLKVKAITKSKDRFYNYSFDYLIEECVVQILWAEKGYNFEVYPSKRNMVLSYTYEKFIQPLYPNAIRPIALKFKTRANPNLDILKR